MSKFCSECGAMLNDDARFCENCGTPCEPAGKQNPIPEQPVAEQPVPAQPAPEQPAPAQPVPVRPVYEQPAQPKASGYRYASPINAGQQAVYPAAPDAPGESDKKSHLGIGIAVAVIAVVLIAAAIIVFFVWKPFDKKEDSPSGTPTATESATVEPTRSGDTSATQTPTEAPTAAPTEEPTEAPTEAPADTDMSLEEFLESDVGKSMIDGVISGVESSSGGAGTAKCYADGQCLVVEFRFTQEFDASAIDQIKTLLQSTLDEDSMADYAATMINGIELLGVSDIQLKLEYRTTDGQLLASRVFE